MAEESFVISRFLAKFSKVCSRKIFVIYKSRKKKSFKLAKVKKSKNQITKQLDQGAKTDEVNVKLRLSMLKPLHVGWVVEFYNQMSSTKGRKKSSKVGGEQLELRMQFALGQNHPSIHFMILKGRTDEADDEGNDSD